MKNIFLSSVARGLKPYRDAVFTAINSLDGYHCSRMEDFGARDAPSLEVCRLKVAECDIYLAIVGHEYGTEVPGTEKSYTETEYDVAVSLNKSLLLFLAPEEAPIRADLVESDDKRTKQRAFRSRVMGDRQVAFFQPQTDISTTTGRPIAELVVEAIHNMRDELMSREKTDGDVTWLLVPFVTQAPGFDTGIAIANTTADPFGTVPHHGSCTLHFYGHVSERHPQIVAELRGRSEGKFDASYEQFATALQKTGLPPEAATIRKRVWQAQTSAEVEAGEELNFSLFAGNTSALLLPTPRFNGYIFAECRFAHARGFAMITDLGCQKVAAGYLAEVVKR